MADETRAPARRRRRRHHPLPDPRPPRQILSEEVLLTREMLARILGYRSVRSVDVIVQEDCASDEPCLKPIYLRRPSRTGQIPLIPQAFPSLKSARWRVEDVLAYLRKCQVDFPADLEWKFGADA